MKRILNSGKLAGGAFVLAVSIAFMSTAYARPLDCRTYKSPIVVCPFQHMD